MAGLVPAIHALFSARFKEDVDARHKAGHDGNEMQPSSIDAVIVRHSKSLGLHRQMHLVLKTRVEIGDK
jgi:hypothetical protein